MPLLVIMMMVRTITVIYVVTWAKSVTKGPILVGPTLTALVKLIGVIIFGAEVAIRTEGVCLFLLQH